jgi:hypothetical protein
LQSLSSTTVVPVAVFLRDVWVPAPTGSTYLVRSGNITVDGVAADVAHNGGAQHASQHVVPVHWTFDARAVVTWWMCGCVDGWMGGCAGGSVAAGTSDNHANWTTFALTPLLSSFAAPGAFSVAPGTNASFDVFASVVVEYQDAFSGNVSRRCVLCTVVVCASRLTWSSAVHRLVC